MPTLRIKLADHNEVTHGLAADRVTIGRRPDNTIQIIDRSVSGHHAELIADDGHYRLHDLGSTNLSFVDGSPVTDYHLHQECRIAFGTVQCVFDPLGGSGLPRLSMAQMEKDLAFVRGENADLLGQIVALQRQIDILGSARLVTKKADHTPFAAANDTLKTIIAERDDLRHLTAGLKLELERLREELAATIHERDTARQTYELLQVEKVIHCRELQGLRQKVAGDTAPTNDSALAPTPEPSPGDTAVAGSVAVATLIPAALAQSPTSAMAQPSVTLLSSVEIPSESTQKITLPLPPVLQAIAAPLKCLSTALNRLSSNINDRGARAQLATQGNKLAQAASILGNHPIVRLCLAVEGLLQECVGHPESLAPGKIQSLTQATELISSLLDPRHHDRAKAFSHPKVLAVDDDVDTLHTLAATLELAQLSTTTCSDGDTAQSLMEKEDYDLLLLDISLPEVSGPALCARLRRNDRYRKTPVIFLTAANAFDHRAKASLGGGNDFLPKPFNAAELTVKAETWIWKSRLGLL
jgi:CheY-like chemotaxis protein/pSer/pThr/pTyr-binding forkhead associated (FHA) protein